MRRPRSGRRLIGALLAGALACAPGARAQAPFPVPVPGELLLLPLLLLALPLAHEWSGSDKDRLAQLEKRQDWGGVAALAERRLAERPTDARWLELRGRARMRLGQWAAAAADLRAAWTGPGARPERHQALGLALALCESIAGDTEAALATLAGLRAPGAGLAADPSASAADGAGASASAAKPQASAGAAPPLPSWEPVYQLGALALRRGDAAALAEAIATLGPLRPVAAQALRADAEALAATGAPPGHVVAGWPTAGEAHRLVIGPHGLTLSHAAWSAGPDGAEQRVQGGRDRNLMRGVEARLATRTAYAASDGRLDAAVVFSANERQAYGMGAWDVADPCAVETPGLLHRSRFGSAFDRPECLSVRRVAAGEAPAAAIAPVLAHAAAAGVALPTLAYEIGYTRYGLDWAVAAQLRLPLTHLPGDLAAVSWALALATALRPLAEDGRPRQAVLPALPLRR